MHLVGVKLKNFRCYREETTISLEKFVTIVGRNDAGKSAILEALAVFFGEVELEQSDLSIGANPATIEITCIFDSLPEEVVLDTNHPTSFAAEYLSQNGKLEVIKRYAVGAKATQLGMWIKCRHPTAENYSDLLKLKKDELKERAETLGVDLTDVDTRKNPPMRKAMGILR
jgi:predicted ATP-dependent endonuclease of OLD family